MTVISTKCPILNKDFRLGFSNSSPDLEVLVMYEVIPQGVERVTGIICPEYLEEESGACNTNVNHTKCIYAEGFSPVR